MRFYIVEITIPDEGADAVVAFKQGNHVLVRQFGEEDDAPSLVVAALREAADQIEEGGIPIRVENNN